ncbi:DUF7256 domain-containing protein [Pseudomonas cremoricolorata]|uniref:DUF7256 domain-containing protein n=1 Tax=Pseudomonas cremoricolorata TaxID=157783 RepID=UPI00040A4F0E|nr:hypothetical protein [Pseudomonas cremoricolorata]
MKPSRIAALRPGLRVEELPGALAQKAAEADAHGHLPDTHCRGFSLQLDDQGQVGTVRWFGRFERSVAIEGLYIGMPYAAAIAANPLLEPLPSSPDDPGELLRCHMHTAEGHDLTVMFFDGVLTAVQISRPGAVYPAPPKLLADPSLTCAYDLLRAPHSHLPHSARGAEWAGGWSLGLPPGISTAQWPLSHSMGHPLRHAFTLWLAPQYRTQGQDYVALSLFVDDQYEELPDCAEVQAFFAAPLPAQAPDDPTLLALWQHRQGRHPRQFDMSDILGTHYAALWLTQAEFDAGLCQPPRLPAAPWLGDEPQWLEQDYVTYFHGLQVRNPGQPALACAPGTGLESAFAIRAVLREDDPNIGKPPREWPDECVDSGYIIAFSEEGQAQGLERFFASNHLGGTMMPQQAYPAFGPRYLECEEDFGGFNFGGGNAQLDLASMELDWACG